MFICLSEALFPVHGKLPPGQFPPGKLPPGKLPPRIIPTKKTPSWKIPTHEKPPLPGRFLPYDPNPSSNFDSRNFFTGKLPAAD